MVLHGIYFDPDRIAAFCREHGVARLSLFGSILTEAFGPQSDIDVLVEFPPEAKFGLFKLGRMQQDLSEMFGRTVDLHEPETLSRYFRDEVMRLAAVQYAA
ncbi:MAG TPA: nucleotidyltransferase family protein [Phycisphaerales bacterium]|nr:nucleotidyltransferase family protein [Phycisphaerales bacterium]